MAKIFIAVALLAALAVCNAEQPRFRAQRAGKRFLARQVEIPREAPYPAAGFRPETPFTLPNEEPAVEFGSPEQQLAGEPALEYGPPALEYGPPALEFGAPAIEYGPPLDESFPVQPSEDPNVFSVSGSLDAGIEIAKLTAARKVARLRSGKLIRRPVAQKLIARPVYAQQPFAYSAQYQRW